MDAVSEFKVQTQTRTAEFGEFSGAVIIVNARSGTNEFHGSAYEFLRNSDLDANNFFNNANLVSKNPARNNFSTERSAGRSAKIIRSSSCRRKR